MRSEAVNLHCRKERKCYLLTQRLRKPIIHRYVASLEVMPSGRELMVSERRRSYAVGMLEGQANGQRCLSRTLGRRIDPACYDVIGQLLRKMLANDLELAASLARVLPAQMWAKGEILLIRITSAAPMPMEGVLKLFFWRQLPNQFLLQERTTRQGCMLHVPLRQTAGHLCEGAVVYILL